MLEKLLFKSNKFGTNFKKISYKIRGKKDDIVIITIQNCEINKIPLL